MLALHFHVLLHILHIRGQENKVVNNKLAVIVTIHLQQTHILGS